MIKKSLLLLTIASLMSFGVANMQAGAPGYWCNKEQEYNSVPEAIALAVTLAGGAVGTYVLTDELNWPVGYAFCALSAATSAIIVAIKHDNHRYGSKERAYYDRMVKAFLTLMAPSTLAAGITLPKEYDNAVLLGCGLLGSVATLVAWL